MAILVRDMRQVRPDLTPDEAERSTKHLLATMAKDKALTGHDFRSASFEALGGALYAQARLRQVDDSSRHVVVQLFSGRIVEGTFEAVETELRERPHANLYDIPEVARVWRNRQTTLVFEASVPAGPFGRLGKSLAINCATFVNDVRGDTLKLQELCDEMRTHGVVFQTAPTCSSKD